MFNRIAVVLAISICVWGASVLGAEPPAKGPGIFVPTPKGDNETLDTPKPNTERLEPECLMGRHDEMISGAVLGIDAAGKVDFAGPMIDGRAKFLTSALDSIIFGSIDAEPVTHRITLTTGETIIGRLTAVTAEAVIVETKQAGQFKVPPDSVSSIVLAPPPGLDTATNFTFGDFGGWETDADRWVIRRGRLVPLRGNSVPLRLKTDLKGAFTLVAVVRPTGESPSCRMTLMANQPETDKATTRVTARISGNSVSMEARQPNGGTSTSTNLYNPKWKSPVTLRLSFDPAGGPNGGNTRFMNEAQVMLSLNITLTPAKDQYVIFEPTGPMEIESLAVLPGVVTADTPKPAEDQADAKPIIDFSNGDHLQFSSLTAVDGNVKAVLPTGNLEFKIDRISRVTFGRGVKPAAAKPGQATVSCASGRFTGTIKKLSDSGLEFHSDTLGDLMIRRSSIREITFSQGEEKK
jgi:hypothetical protein